MPDDKFGIYYVGTNKYFTYGKKYYLSLSSVHASGEKSYSLYNDGGGVHYIYTSELNDFLSLEEYREFTLNKLGIK